MGEILSRAEVEAILAAVQPSRPGSQPVAKAPHDSAGEAWEVHDFRRAEPLQGMSLKIVQALHEGICRRWQARLQSLFQAAIKIRSVGACQSTAAEFLPAVSSECVICRIAHTRSTVDSLLVWSFDLVQSLVTGMLGGAMVASNEQAPHAMTHIELRLLGRLNEAVIRELSELLEEPLAVAAVIPDLGEIPELGTKCPRVWFSFEVSVGSVCGLMHLGIPGPISALPESTGSDSSDMALRTVGVESIPDGIRHVSVQVSANLAQVRLRAVDVAGLQVGDIVMTELSPSETVSLQLDGRTLCRATVGTLLGRTALRLVEPLNRAAEGRQ